MLNQMRFLTVDAVQEMRRTVMKIRQGEDEGSASVAPETSTDAESHRQKYHVAWSQMAGSPSSQQLI